MAELSVIKAIQSLRTPFWDTAMKAITVLGDELLFMVVAVVIFWCFDKRFGYKLINVYLLGCTVIEGVKAIVGRARPYTYDGVTSVGEKTSGYSFPSGHSHSIANLSTQLCQKTRKSFVYIITGVITLLVAFSRLYLGQHFLTDVIVGVTLGIGLALLLSMLFELLGDREEYLVLGVFPLCAIILLVLVLVGDPSAGALKVLGAYSAVSLGYFLEKKYVRFNEKNKWYFQLLKVVIGLVLTLIVKEGLKLIIPQTMPVLYGFVRYFAVGITASLAVPALFKLTKLSKN